MPYTMTETFKDSNSVFVQQKSKGYVNSKFSLKVLSMLIDVSYWMAGRLFVLIFNFD